MMAGPDAYALIKHFEGLRLHSYLDGGNRAAIGWGHRGDDVHHPMIIGREEADRLLMDDVHFVETQLTRMITREPIMQRHFDAMVSWAYNIGVERAKKSTLIKFYNFAMDKEAATEFLRWHNIKINGKPIIFKSLHNRRNVERQLFLTGDLMID